MIIKPRKLVLLYHSLCLEEESSRDGYVSRHRSLSVRLLDRQLSWISQFADFVSLDALTSIEDPERWKVAITLDDGYRNNLTLGLPVFERYKAPITWFVCTEFVEDDRLPWWDLMDYVLETIRSPLPVSAWGDHYRFDLSEPGERTRFRRVVRPWFLKKSRSESNPVRRQLEEALPGSVPPNALADVTDVREAAGHPLVNIGGHTVTHPNMACLSEQEQRREVEEGKRVLEDWTGKPPHWFAYPYGGGDHWNRSAKRVVRDAGFHGGVTTRRAYATQARDRFEVPRLNMSNSALWKSQMWVLATNACRRAARTVRTLRGLIN